MQTTAHVAGAMLQVQCKGMESLAAYSGGVLQTDAWHTCVSGSEVSKSKGSCVNRSLGLATSGSSDDSGVALTNSHLSLQEGRSWSVNYTYMSGRALLRFPCFGQGLPSCLPFAVADVKGRRGQELGLQYRQVAAQVTKQHLTHAPLLS
jgi:hypothetical protein